MSSLESTEPTHNAAPEGVPTMELLHFYNSRAANEKRCTTALRTYLHILQNWKIQYVPQSPGDEPHPHFAEACRMLDCIQYMVDLLALLPQNERAELVAGMMSDEKIQLLEERLDTIREENPSCFRRGGMHH